MDSFVVGAQLLLAATFALAGVAKLFAIGASQQAVADFGVPIRMARVVGILIPVAELAIAVALVIHSSTRWGLAAAFLLLLAFTGGVANAMRRGKDVDCGCFGRVYSATAGSATLIRNASLAVIAAVAFVATPAPAIDDWVAARTAAELVAMALGVATVMLAALSWSLWSRNRKLRHELAHRPTVEESQEHTAEGLPVGSLAPDFALTDVAGATHTLQSLRARGLPVVLTFMDRSCGPCKTLSPELAQWQATLSDRVTIVAVIAGSSEDNAGVWDEYELDLLLYDAPDEMTGNFGLRSTPTALIVNPDGQIASAPYGGVHGVEVIVRLALRQGVEPSAAEAAFAFPRVVEVEPSRA